MVIIQHWKHLPMHCPFHKAILNIFLVFYYQIVKDRSNHTLLNSICQLLFVSPKVIFTSLLDELKILLVEKTTGILGIFIVLVKDLIVLFRDPFHWKLMLICNYSQPIDFGNCKTWFEGKPGLEFFLTNY